MQCKQEEKIRHKLFCEGLPLCLPFRASLSFQCSVTLIAREGTQIGASSIKKLVASIFTPSTYANPPQRDKQRRVRKHAGICDRPGEADDPVLALRHNPRHARRSRQDMVDIVVKRPVVKRLAAKDGVGMMLGWH